MDRKRQDGANLLVTRPINLAIDIKRDGRAVNLQQQQHFISDGPSAACHLHTSVCCESDTIDFHTVFSDRDNKLITCTAESGVKAITPLVSLPFIRMSSFSLSVFASRKMNLHQPELLVKDKDIRLAGDQSEATLPGLPSLKLTLKHNHYLLKLLPCYSMCQLTKCMFPKCQKLNSGSPFLTFCPTVFLHVLASQLTD